MRLEGRTLWWNNEISKEICQMRKDLHIAAKVADAAAACVPIPVWCTCYDTGLAAMVT